VPRRTRPQVSVLRFRLRGQCSRHIVDACEAGTRTSTQESEKDMETVGVRGGSGTETQDVPDHVAPNDTCGERIVVGLDGSYASALAVRWAAGQASELGLVLDVVAVWTDLVTTRPTLDDLESPSAVARERLDHALAHLVRAPNPPERVLVTPLRGSPGEVLVARARRARLLVLGIGGIDSAAVLGPTGLHCLKHSTAPIVFVPRSDV